MEPSKEREKKILKVISFLFLLAYVVFMFIYFVFY
jgi:Ca2+/Na+ antiporter